jgi:Zn-dependent protease with chaperone function
MANIIEEMAIAAGLPAPRLMLVDSPAINAAAVGRSHATATILVTCGLIEGLDRRETGTVAAHLVATIAAGDLGLGVSVLAVFQTLGFFLTILDLPLRWSASRALGSLILVGLGISRSPEAVTRVGEMLEDGLDAASTDAVTRIFAWVEVARWRTAAIVPLLPFILLSLFMKLVLFLWTALFLGPPLGFLWRNRRYAADAVAVQLTRDPDALALALRQIAGSDVPAGGEGRAYLFVHAARGAIAGGRRGMTMSLHPTIGRRVARLVAMGANSVGPAQPIWANLAEFSRHPMRAALVAGLLLLLIPLVAALAALVAYITAIVMTIALAAGLGIASAVVGG